MFNFISLAITVTRVVNSILFVDVVNDIESNPFIIATIAVSLFAGVLIIVAVIMLILLIKKQSDINRTCLLYSFSVLQ